MLKYIVVVIILFLFGIGTYNVYAQYTPGLQFPLRGTEVPSPGDWVRADDIAVRNRNVLLSIHNATLVVYANTNSMDPVLDESANGIEIQPVKERLGIGDIISYRSRREKMIIVHRIISVGEDDFGTYYITKGDNNRDQDPEKVRFEDIEGVVVALIY
ncbi:signal peptidase I [Candidatus Woesearchaeota archaeon]|nr:signal peptidase I [Candidatus Woesearchaeota archaeon]